MLSLSNYGSKLDMGYREHVELNPFMANYDYDEVQKSIRFLRSMKDEFYHECVDYIESFLPYVSNMAEFKAFDHIGYVLSHDKKTCTNNEHYISFKEIDDRFGIDRILNWVHENQITGICCGSTKECLWGSTVEGYTGPIYYLNTKEAEGK